jgi:hypothetical protein
MFSQSKPIPSGLPPSASSGRSMYIYICNYLINQISVGSVLLHDDAVASGSSVAVDMDHIERNRVQQQISLIDEQDTYLQARNSTMESIESSIAELGSIFRQLANLVAEQGETITRFVNPSIYCFISYHIYTGLIVDHLQAEMMSSNPFSE